MDKEHDQMKRIVLYNPSISTLNIGDEIISESAISYIKRLYPDAFYTQISTHLPISRQYMQHIKNFDLRFVCGTNLLKGDMLHGFRQWDISLWNASCVGKCILLGCGWWQYQKNTDLYTRLLYRSVLSKEYIHSVRDSYTEKKLKELGFENIVNTGCPTMWSFTEEFCSDIPRVKTESVITTLTDYNRDRKCDSEMIDQLTLNYKCVYLWIQGSEDWNYYTEIKRDKWKNVRILNPNLAEYDAILSGEDVEYIGTRLHAGIRALQKKKRTLILAVDNRAIEKKRDFNLPVLSRECISELHTYINSPRITNIIIPSKNIVRFTKQFE